VVTADVGDDVHLDGVFGEERGQRSQGQVSAADTARPQDAGQLLEVAAHRRHHVRDRGSELLPARQPP